MAEIEVATFEQIATLLSQLSTNYSNLAINYYDIFYNPVPQDVTIQLYDAAGVLKNYVIPNRAKDFRFVLNGKGSPEGSVSADVGTTYQDTLNGRFYIKQLGADNKGWVEIASSEDFIKDEGSPEGVIAKPTGTLYIDTSVGSLYIKTTGTGSTGWVELPKSGDFVNKDLSNISLEGEKKFANPALSNLNALGESHFANPSLSNLDNTGKGIINGKENVNNKTSVIDSSSTNIQYPSAKAVYTVTSGLSTQVDSKANADLDNLSGIGLAKLGKDKIVNTHINGASGYIELSNGAIIQWGRWSGGDAVNINVFYPKPFTTANISVIYSKNAYNPGAERPDGGLINVTSTYFTVTQNGGSGGLGGWIAIGY